MSKVLTKAALDVLGERQRQQEVEGWTAEHDDRHTDGSLARAASAYVLYVTGHTTLALQAWPLSWLRKWYKPTDRRRTLVKATALLLAELERLDRAAGGCPGCGFEDCLCGKRPEGSGALA